MLHVYNTIHINMKSTLLAVTSEEHSVSRHITVQKIRWGPFSSKKRQ